MTRAIDPFEEFLRKKKVEMLEQRGRGESASATTEESLPEEQEEQEEPVLSPTLSKEDPESEARLREEMDEFFESGQTAAAELYSKVDTGITDDKVEEIRDALDDVFEEDAPAPQTADEGENETFVNFFRQVQERYDEDERPPIAGPQAPAPTARPRAESELDSTVPSSMSASIAEEVVDAYIVESGPEESALDLLTDLAEEETAVQGEHSVAAARDAGRLDLSQILSGPIGENELPQRVDLLCRLVAKLVERAGISESEIIEVLIKSGVEF